MIKIEIKSWHEGKILFSHECKDNTIKLTVEAAVKAKVSLAFANLRSAVLSSADLRSADLRSADLRSADLRSAVLSSADLSSADLRSADLRSAVLSSADLSSAVLSYAVLSSADLRSADLRYADLRYAVLRYAVLRYAVLSYAVLSYAVLSSADLSYAVLSYAVLSYATLMNGEKIIASERPVFQIGGIGSSERILIAFLTDKGIRLTTGCFFGSMEQFKEKLKETHKDGVHAEEYTAALALIETHFKLWPAKKNERQNV